LWQLAQTWFGFEGQHAPATRKVLRSISTGSRLRSGSCQTQRKTVSA
jgi:hypothetical protein